MKICLACTLGDHTLCETAPECDCECVEDAEKRIQQEKERYGIEENRTCPKCGGSGGGDEPVLRCPDCQGTGEVCD